MTKIKPKYSENTLHTIGFQFPVFKNNKNNLMSFLLSLFGTNRKVEDKHRGWHFHITHATDECAGKVMISDLKIQRDASLGSQLIAGGSGQMTQLKPRLHREGMPFLVKSASTVSTTTPHFQSV